MEAFAQVGWKQANKTSSNKQSVCRGKMETQGVSCALAFASIRAELTQPGGNTETKSEVLHMLWC